jgi:hypothetical protein
MKITKGSSSPRDGEVELLYLLPHTDGTPIHLLIHLILNLILSKETDLQRLSRISVDVCEEAQHAISEDTREQKPPKAWHSVFRFHQDVAD